MPHRHILRAAVLVTLGLALSCAGQQRVQTETSLAKALISDEQVAQLGEQVHRELEAQGVRYVTDPTVTRYVEGVAGRIFDQALRDRPGIQYHVHVIDDPKTVNAFATPGGHTYVYTGLLLAAANEAEMAGVIAHEAGHVAGRHVERAMVNSYGLEALVSAALGQNPSAAKAMAANVLGTGILRAHSRSEETEADEYGARYISALNYDPKAMITFFQKLQSGEKGGRALAWLSTHPVTADRITHLQGYIAQNHLGGTVLNAQRITTIKQALTTRASR